MGDNETSDDTAGAETIARFAELSSSRAYGGYNTTPEIHASLMESVKEIKRNLR